MTTEDNGNVTRGTHLELWPHLKKINEDYERLYPNKEIELIDYMNYLTLKEWQEYQASIPIYTDEQIANLTEMIREADRLFETSGGSTRHWVKECLIPVLESKGIKIKFNN